MAKRSKDGQHTHNNKVKVIARQLQREGWNVKADLPGYERPAPIGKAQYIPDIEATKCGARKIIEIETPDSLKTDKNQISAFKRSAAQQNRTTFDLVVANQKKK